MACLSVVDGREEWRLYWRLPGGFDGISVPVFGVASRRRGFSQRGSAGFDLDTEALALLDKAIKVHVDNAAVDGWVPTGPVDAQSLIATDRLRFDDLATLFGKKIRFVKVSLELKPATE